MHKGVNTVEINTEAASSDITEYPPPDDKPCASMFGFLCCYIVFISSFHIYTMHARLLSVAHVLHFIFQRRPSLSNRTQPNIATCLEVNKICKVTFKMLWKLLWSSTPNCNLSFTASDTTKHMMHDIHCNIHIHVPQL